MTATCCSSAGGRSSCGPRRGTAPVDPRLPGNAADDRTDDLTAAIATQVSQRWLPDAANVAAAEVRFDQEALILRGWEDLEDFEAQLANRGIKDVLIVCCDGLTGFPEAIEATWPKAMVQTCLVHLIRASMRFVSYGDRKAVAAMLRPIYTAADENAAQAALEAFADSNLGRKYPATTAAWHSAWERFIPFLAFGPALRKVIYTTNSIESLNYQLRKIIKNRGHFPNDEAVVKLLWLAIRNIEDKRARERAKQATRGKKRQSVPRLVEGATVTGWKAALGELALVYPDRINTHL